MKPSPINYFFAHRWPLKGFLAVWTLFSLVLVIRILPSGPYDQDHFWSDWAKTAAVHGLLMPALAFGWVPIAVIVVGPLNAIGARLAGAPFYVGERVQILVGPHRNRVVEI